MEEIEKLYFTIGEVANELCISTTLVREYEKFFNLKIPRTGIPKGIGKKGARSYTINQLEKLRYIQHLIRVEGYRYVGALKKFKEKYDKAQDL